MIIINNFPGCQSSLNLEVMLDQLSLSSILHEQEGRFGQRIWLYLVDS